jgi:Ser/Thr protein kinase RdoA (MazF antagonist)
VSFLRSEVSALLPHISHPSLPPPCVLHGDLFLENCIVAGDGDEASLLGVIDWEEICVGPHLLDVAMTLVGCAYDDDDRLDCDLASAFLSAYHSTRPLSASDVAMFESFLRYACLSIAFWRFRQFNVRVPNAERKEAYRPMQRRIERLQRAEDGEKLMILLHRITSHRITDRN